MKKCVVTSQGSTRGKSNNNNNQKSSSNNNNNNNNKVVIVAPPQHQIPHQIALAAAAVAAARTPSPISQLQQQSTTAQATSANVSPSVAIPALKKRTGVVKQSIPPPVPPRGSPRSKSKVVGVSSSSSLFLHDKIVTDKVNGRRKVEEWLSQIEPMAPQKPFHVSNIVNLSSIDDDKTIEFQSITKLIETFSSQQSADEVDERKTKKIISDSNFVRNRVDCFNSLDRIRSRNLMSSDGGTDSGIDIPIGLRIRRPTTINCYSKNVEEFV